jgi:NADH:ubiquinone oxidoreductase subunit
MQIIDKILIKLTSTYKAMDEFGNKYYEARFRTNARGKKVRYVIYKGRVEASKVPPMWHAWLNYLSNEIPNIIASRYNWQKDFLPNVTGTKFAYVPNHDKLSNDYKAWKPNTINSIGKTK